MPSPSPQISLLRHRSALSSKSKDAFVATLNALYATRYREREIQAYKAVKLLFEAEGLVMPPFSMTSKESVEGWKRLDEDALQGRLRARARELRAYFEGVDAAAAVKREEEEEALQGRLRARAGKMRAYFEALDAAAAAAREKEALQTRMRARAAALRSYFEQLDAGAAARRAAMKGEEVLATEKATEVVEFAKAADVRVSLAPRFSAGLVTASEMLPFLLMGLFCVGMFKLEMRHVWVFLYVFLDWEEGVMV